MLWCAWICGMKYFWKYRMRILFAAWKNLQEKKNNHHYTVMRSSKRMSGNKVCHHLAPFTNLYMSNVIKLQHCAVAVHVPHITWISDLFSKAVVLPRFLLACSVKCMKYMKFINFHIYTHKVALWLNYKDSIFFF